MWLQTRGIYTVRPYPRIHKIANSALNEILKKLHNGYDNVLSNAPASCKSGVSNPSENQP